jgi:hypothetical protein
MIPAVNQISKYQQFSSKKQKLDQINKANAILNGGISNSGGKKDLITYPSAEMATMPRNHP